MVFMETLKDTIEITTTPEKIFDGLIKVFSSQEYFKEWHKDHVRCQWLKGKPFEEGSILYVEEYVHGKLHKMRFLSTRLEPYRKIEYRLLFPLSVLCPRGSFSVEPKGASCIFTATLTFRFSWFLKRFAKDNVDAMKSHMKEEGENLKKMIENSF